MRSRMLFSGVVGALLGAAIVIGITYRPATQAALTPGDTVLYSVVAGIVTASLIWFVLHFFRSAILPWYHRLIYQGLDLSGEWQILLGPDGVLNPHFQFFATLEQVASEVSGTAVAIFNSRKDVRTYRVRGFARDRLLAISLEKADRRRLGIGTSLVEAVGVGDRLEGYYCGYDSGPSGLRSDRCVWVRREEHQEGQKEAHNEAAPADQKAPLSGR
jgi:hypothetical protein